MYINIPCSSNLFINVFIYLFSLEGTKPMIKVSLTRDVAGQRVPSPNIAFFSSRGPSALFPELLLVLIIGESP